MKQRGWILIGCLFLSGCQPTPATDATPAPTAAVNTLGEEISFESEEWYDMMEIVQINREEARADFTPYSTPQEALAAETSALDELDGSSSSRVQSLNGDWAFYYAANPFQRLKTLSGNNARFYWEDWDTSNWDTIPVPSNIQTQRNEDGTFRYEKPIYVNQIYPWLNWESLQYGWQGQPLAPTVFNSVAHYKREFTIDPQLQDKTLFVRFEGVESAFYLYINGQQAGYSEDSATPAEFNITPYLKEGVNTIAVEVYRWSDASYFENQDFIRLSGIFRDVTLIGREEMEIRDLFAHCQLDDDFQTAQLTVETALRNLSDATLNDYTLTLDLLDHGQSVLDQPLSVPVKALQGQSEQQIQSTLSVRNPQLWSPDHPYLYHLTLTLRDARGQPVEALCQRIGLREIHVEPSEEGASRILLNGQPLLLKGVNRHETDALTGRALTFQQILDDLTMMKAYNINAFRTSHYPNQSLTYDIADEIGLIVVDEANIESHIGEVELKIPGNNLIYNTLILDRTISMVERDKNHASVLFWSLGNESTYQEYEMNSDYPFYNSSMWILQRDPSRLRVYERDNRIGEDRQSSMVDVVSTQYWSLDRLTDYARSQSAPLFQSEYAHAMGNGVGNLQEYADVFRQFPQLQGGFLWDFIDQTILTTTGETTYYGYGGDWGETLHDGDFCGNGLVNADRTPSAEMAEVKKVFQDIRFDYQHDQITVFNDFLNTSLNEFDLEVQLLQNGQPFYTAMLPGPDIPPQSSAALPLSLPQYEQEGEIILQIRALYRNDQNWANRWGGHAGQELAFEQWILYSESPDLSLKEGGILQSRQQDDVLTLSGTTAYQQHFELQLDLNTLQILRYDLDQQTLLSGGPLPSFYRAPVSNDPDFSKALAVDVQQIQLSDIQTDLQPQQARITASGFCTELDSHFTLDLTVSAQGEIRIETSLDAPSLQKAGEIARVGLRMSLGSSVQRYRAYGRGPFENYVDRHTGSRLGVWEGRIDQRYNDQLLKPQDSGNMTDVRQLELLSDQHALSLQFSQPLGINMLFYDDLDLAQADHLYQCSRLETPILHLDIAQRGLGNASNGPEPLPQYKIDQQRSYRFALLLRPQTIPS